MWHRYTAIALTGLLVSAGSFTLAAGTQCTRHDGRLNALAGKLGLSEQQTQQIRKIHSTYRKDAAPLKQQLRTLRGQQRQEMAKVLTVQQRDKLRGLMQAHWQKQWEAVAAKLDLTATQKERIDKVRSEFRTKFQALASGASDKKPAEFHKLRREVRHAVAAELTKEQRSLLRGILRAEKRARHNAETRTAFWKSVGENLGVTAEQKEQFQKIRASFAAQREKPLAQLKKLHAEKRAAFRKVLTDEQRAKRKEMHRS